MSLVALPTSSTNRKWMTWLLVPVGVAVALAATWALTRPNSAAGPIAGSLYRVGQVDMDVRIVKDGELQAVNAIEIQSQVEGQTTIQTLVKEGTFVKKGDVLITLDSAEIRQKIEDTYLDIQKAEADLTNARELREIQVSTNNANLEAAEVAVTLAELALKQYVEGNYPQQLASAEIELAMAEINLKNKEEKLSQTQALYAKGFVTATQLKEDELGVKTARNELEKARTALKVLTEYTHGMTLAERQSELSQAQQKLARTKRENAASLNQRDADVRAKQQALEVLQRRMERYEEQLAACTIRAPADGMVVYATSNDRNAQSSLQEGTQVRERQALLRLPDTSSMKVIVRIPETQVARLKLGQRAFVTISNLEEPIGATLSKISVLADNSSRWWNPDLKEYPVDLALDHTPSTVKPGMSANASIYVERLKDVLAVPLTSIYSRGSRSFVFVPRSDKEYEAREVKIGATNETHAQVTSGVNSGETVKILEIGEGQLLLERAGIKLPPERTLGPGEPGSGPEGQEGEPRGDGGAPRVPGGPGAAEGGAVGPGGPAVPGADAPGDAAQPNPDRPRRDGAAGGGGEGRRRGPRRGGDGAPANPEPTAPSEPGK